jgi:hypothetical protein
MIRALAGSALLVLLVGAACACSQPQPKTSEGEANKVEKADDMEVRNKDNVPAEAEPAPVADAVETASTAPVADFVQKFNAGEVDALGKRFGDRIDYRVFTRAPQLGKLGVIEPQKADAFIKGYVEQMDRDELRTLYATGWTDAKVGAKKHDVGLVVVRSEGLESMLGRRLYVPALVFGVRSTDGGDEIVFGTVFAELLEEIGMQEGSMDRVIREGIGVRPEEFGASAE